MIKVQRTDHADRIEMKCAQLQGFGVECAEARWMNMMGTISSVLGAMAFVYMYFEFSTYRRPDLWKLGFAFVVSVAANVFLPISGMMNAALYYGIVVSIYLFVFRESIFVSAANTYLMFMIQMIAAILTSCIVLLYSRNLVDYRYALHADDVGYTLIFTLLLLVMAFLTRKGLYSLNRYFERLKDNQRRLLTVNTLLMLGLFLYLRLFIKNGVVIAAIKNTGLEWHFALRLLVGVGVFLWLVYTMNRMRLEFSTGRRKNWQTVTDLVVDAKMNKTPLSVIYFELPYFSEIVKKYGAKEGKMLMQLARSAADEAASDAPILRLKENALLIMLDRMDQIMASQIGDRVERLFKNKIASFTDEYGSNCLLGVSQYNPVTHETHQDLIHAAREDAYR